jgi:hypothetical protein
MRASSDMADGGVNWGWSRSRGTAPPNGDPVRRLVSRSAAVVAPSFPSRPRNPTPARRNPGTHPGLFPSVPTGIGGAARRVTAVYAAAAASDSSAVCGTAMVPPRVPRMMFYQAGSVPPQSLESNHDPRFPVCHLAGESSDIPGDAGWSELIMDHCGANSVGLSLRQRKRWAVSCLAPPFKFVETMAENRQRSLNGSNAACAHTNEQ